MYLRGKMRAEGAPENFEVPKCQNLTKSLGFWISQLSNKRKVGRRVMGKIGTDIVGFCRLSTTKYINDEFSSKKQRTKNPNVIQNLKHSKTRRVFFSLQKVFFSLKKKVP